MRTLTAPSPVPSCGAAALAGGRRPVFPALPARRTAAPAHRAGPALPTLLTCGAAALAGRRRSVFPAVPARRTAALLRRTGPPFAMLGAALTAFVRDGCTGARASPAAGLAAACCAAPVADRTAVLSHLRQSPRC